MVLKVESIRARLAKLEEIATRLRELKTSKAHSDRAPYVEDWAAERGLHLGAELIFDLGNHILSSHFGVQPQGYADVLEQLGRADVLSPQLLGELRGLAGFRNILVHDYSGLDPEILERSLQLAPGHFDAVAQAVRRWLEGLGPKLPGA
ncbi:MAG TPA: DUF86 domain-containing protein [Thermoanaerobaculia bacterium]|nr:DUF86 domain-containing protein [Thermoanaerobaculia bacterium]